MQGTGLLKKKVLSKADVLASGVVCVFLLIVPVGAVEITVSVELQGAVSNAFSRNVDFVATDASGNVVHEWSGESVDFEDGTGNVSLLNAPEGTASLSAKTEYTLRRRVDCVSENGTLAAAFTGQSQLLGGDLNGDNVVDMRDFTRLRYHWMIENDAADISGSGSTNMDDYSILRSNWHKQGELL